MKAYDNAFEIMHEPIKAKLMLEKCCLMNCILDKMEELRLNQTEAAEIMKVTQPRISNLHKGKISKFTLDLLFLMHERIKAV